MNMALFDLATLSKICRDKYQPKHHPIRLFEANEGLPILQTMALRQFQRGVLFCKSLFVIHPVVFQGTSEIVLSKSQ